MIVSFQNAAMGTFYVDDTTFEIVQGTSIAHPWFDDCKNGYITFEIVRETCKTIRLPICFTCTLRVYAGTLSFGKING